MTAAMEETIRRIQVLGVAIAGLLPCQENKGVHGVILINNEGIPLKTTMVSRLRNTYRRPSRLAGGRGVVQGFSCTQHLQRPDQWE
jgi:hypothetical protein